mgnify:CR=1 FL=1
MRIATWNVNSLGARMERVLGWVEHARPDVLLLQETKLSDEAAPHQAFAAAGYQMAHHGQGRWNGVAILSRVGLDAVEVGFGDPPRAPSDVEKSDDEETADPFAEARIIAASCAAAMNCGAGSDIGHLALAFERTVRKPPTQAKGINDDRNHRFVDDAAV